MEFKFKIGDYVTLKAHVDLYDLADAGPLVVGERFAQQCEGGEQRHYVCRAITAPEFKRSAGVCTSYTQFKEAELVPLDIDAYRAARDARDGWK
jgi:hypothetical protein